MTAKYDPFHRLSSESILHGADSIPVLHDLRYRQNDLLDGYGLGTKLNASFKYEPQRAILTQSLVTKSPATDTMYLQRMTWDGAGNVAGMRRNLGDSLGFDVDHLYQLNNIRYPDGQAISTNYDPNGNRTRLRHPMGRGTTDTFTYAVNRVATGNSARKGWTTYKHDSRGNLALEASFAAVADTGNLARAWRIIERRFNKRSELERVRVISRLSTTDTTWLRFEYGEDGNRILSAVAKGGDTTTWTTTHKWIYDGSVIAADSGSDHGWTWHVYNGLNRMAEATDSAGRARVRYVLTDHQGTTQALLGDTGTVLGRWIWDPWGNIEESWSQRTTELLYQGKPYETAMGEWYFNARYYDSERGSFTGRDPKLQFWSPYSYTGNRPLTGTDPTGMYWNYANMDDAQLKMHDDFTSIASISELELYNRISDDPSVLVSHGFYTGDYNAKFTSNGSVNANGQRLASILFTSLDFVLPNVLLHEMVHANQYFNNEQMLLPDGRMDVRVEVPAWDAEVKFLDRNHLYMDPGQRIYYLNRNMWSSEKRAEELYNRGYNAGGKYGF